MKNYKNWWSRFAKDSGSQNLNSLNQISNHQNTERKASHGMPFFSTHLKNSRQPCLLLGIIAFASLILVWQIDMSLFARVMITFIVICYAIHDVISILDKNYQRNFHEIIHNNKKWIIVSKQNNAQLFKLLTISRFLHLAIILKIKLEHNKKVHYLILWEKHTDIDFFRFCNQLIRIGLPND